MVAIRMVVGVVPTAVMVVRMVMAAIPAPMVHRMVTLPRWPHLHNQPHPKLASNPARDTDNPAQGCAGLLFIGAICLITTLQDKRVRICQRTRPRYVTGMAILVRCSPIAT
jgi:hypothetical protein